MTRQLDNRDGSESDTRNDRSSNEFRFTTRDVITFVLIAFSAFIYSLGMVSFVRSGNLFPGGYTGVSRLISLVFTDRLGIPLSFSVVYFILNFITTLFVWKRLGHRFVFFSILWYTLSSVFTTILPVFQVTSDPLLISVFGGLISGFSIGIALQNNASSGGVDFIAIYFSQKFNMPTWNYIMIGNAVILIISGFLFGWNKALYSIIFQFVSTQVVGVMHQRYKFSEIKVVTNEPDEICQIVFGLCHHGVTKVPCEGGYTDKPRWLLMMTVNTYQLKELVDRIHKADSHAFISIDTVDRIVGNYYQQPLP